MKIQGKLKKKSFCFLRLYLLFIYLSEWVRAWAQAGVGGKAEEKQTPAEEGVQCGTDPGFWHHDLSQR